MRFRAIGLVIVLAIFSHTPMAFSAQLTFTPRASAEGEYTDNVFLTHDDTEDDFITTLSAGFTAGLVGPVGLSCAGRLGLLSQGCFWRGSLVRIFTTALDTDQRLAAIFAGRATFILQAEWAASGLDAKERRAFVVALARVAGNRLALAQLATQR